MRQIFEFSQYKPVQKKSQNIFVEDLIEVGGIISEVLSIYTDNESVTLELKRLGSAGSRAGMRLILSRDVQVDVFSYFI